MESKKKKNIKFQKIKEQSFDIKGEPMAQLNAVIKKLKKKQKINNEIKEEKVEDIIQDDNKEKSEEKDIDKKKEDNIDNDNKIEKIKFNSKRKIFN